MDSRHLPALVVLFGLGVFALACGGEAPSKALFK